ncbi:MAG: Rrf2 family transcriptional regulator [Verrucomicrobiales bacterium]
MQLSLFSDYSLRVLMYAAVKADYFQLDEVTAAYRISRHHLAKVVNKLGQAGYLETRRGRGGGIRLAKPAGDIPIGSLIRATENQPLLLECFDLVNAKCPIVGSCKLKGALAQAMNAFYQSLDRFTLQDLVTGPHRDEMTQVLLREKGFDGSSNSDVISRTAAAGELL